jgi:hypothetical protein
MLHPLPVPAGHSLPWHTHGDRAWWFTRVGVQGALRGQATRLLTIFKETCLNTRCLAVEKRTGCKQCLYNGFTNELFNSCSRD